MQTSNPVFNAKLFQIEAPLTTQMTMTGTVLKIGFLLAVTIAAASYAWIEVLVHGGGPTPYMLGGGITGLILGLIISFKPTTAPYLAWAYALAEGLLIGALSAMFESQMPGLPLQAAGGTFATLFSLLLVYSTGAIKPSQSFKRGFATAVGGLMIFYLATFVGSMFGMPLDILYGSGWLGVGLSVVVVVMAAVSLVLDFDFIEEGCSQGAPKYLEWYAAFGLMVSLIWLYIELLRLLAKLQRRD